MNKSIIYLILILIAFIGALTSIILMVSEEEEYSPTCTTCFGSESYWLFDTTPNECQFKFNGKWVDDGKTVRPRCVYPNTEHPNYIEDKYER